MLEPRSIELEPFALRARHVAERTILHVEKRLPEVEAIHIKPVLKYHILSEELPAKELAKNSTFATALTLGDGSLHSEPLRLRIEQPPRLFKPTLSLNFYASVIFADVKTKNGKLHVNQLATLGLTYVLRQV